MSGFSQQTSRFGRKILLFDSYPHRNGHAKCHSSRYRSRSFGVRRASVEFLFFGVKQARACLFAGLFFAAVFTVPRAGLLGIPRYDLLLVIALTILDAMVWAGLESWDELKAITLFHAIGFGLEVFRGHPRSWSYPDPA
jgi:uncharacterized membrane protein YoaT (DUF817 family)